MLSSEIQIFHRIISIIFITHYAVYEYNSTVNLVWEHFKRELCSQEEEKTQCRPSLHESCHSNAGRVGFSDRIFA